MRNKINRQTETESKKNVILWSLPPSANSSVIRSFLQVNKIDFKEENAWGKTRTAEYITKFPTNLAPSLEHGNTCVTENGAILRYLSRAFPQKAGSGYPEEDIKTTAKIDMLVDFINTGICNYLPTAMYTTVGFSVYAGDVADLEETKQFTDKAQEAATAAMLEMLEKKYVDIFLKDTK